MTFLWVLIIAAIIAGVLLFRSGRMQRRTRYIDSPVWQRDHWQEQHERDKVAQDRALKDQ